jgi:hypothetical protein
MTKKFRVLGKEFGKTGMHCSKVFIEDPVNEVIDGLFVTISEDFHLKYGDVSPGQHQEIEDIKSKLIELLQDFAVQNTKTIETDEDVL